MALLSEKTRKFFEGRRGLRARVEADCAGVDNIVWVHSPSYGELEEVRPVLSVMRKIHPEYKFLFTFFSPSGYEHLKDDPAADFVYYMPLDTPWNAKWFLSAVRPVKMIICIADFWPSFLREQHRRGFETYLVSGRFNAEMSYFGTFGKPFRYCFKHCFTKLFVNTPESAEVLEANGIDNFVLTGDPRMDRVLALASEDWNDPVVDAWAGGRKVFVAGSTLPGEDAALVCELANMHPADKFLVVPHEVGEAEVAQLRALFEGRTALYTDGTVDDGAQVLIVNKVGLLSRLYRYGFMAYVGAGFDGAPHSIIEPAAYGIPVCYGPEFGPVWHCSRMIDAGAGFCVHDAVELCSLYDEMLSSPSRLASAGDAARRYCEDGGGVAEKIAKIID